MRFKAHLRVSAGDKKERGLLCGGVDMVVVEKLGKQEKGMPLVLLLSDKDPQVLFQLLINLFSATNCGPQLDTTFRGRPWSFQTLQRYRLAAPAAIMVVSVSSKWAHLPTESTTTMMALYPPDSGSSEMKSMLRVFQWSSGTRSS